MPAKSAKQYRFMQWVAHNKAAQKKTGLSKAQAEEFISKTPKTNKHKWVKHKARKK